MSDRLLYEATYRVPMADIDLSGSIYYAAPYRWREQLVTSWMAEVGHPLGERLAGGENAPAVASSATYRRPIRLDDVLTLRLVADHVGTTSAATRMDALDAGGELAVQVSCTQVWTTRRDGRTVPTPLPGWMRQLLGG